MSPPRVHASLNVDPAKYACEKLGLEAYHRFNAFRCRVIHHHDGPGRGFTAVWQGGKGNPSGRDSSFHMKK